MIPARNGPPRQPEQLQAAADGALLVVFVCHRRAEQEHERVALVARVDLAEVPAEAADHRDGGGYIRLQAARRLRVVLWYVREPDEGHGDLAMLVDQAAAAGVKALGDRRMQERGQAEVVASSTRSVRWGRRRPDQHLDPRDQVCLLAKVDDFDPWAASSRPASTATWPIAAHCSAAAARSIVRPATTYSSRAAGSPTMVPSTGPIAKLARMPSLKTPASVSTVWKAAIAACMSVRTGRHDARPPAVWSDRRGTGPSARLR